MNLGRALGSLLVAAMLVLFPSAAFGYDNDRDSVSADDTTPTVGQDVTVFVECGDSLTARIQVSPRGGAPGDAVYIDDVQTTRSPLKECADGETSFKVEIEAEGRYLVLGKNARGQVLGRSLLVVGDGVRGENASRGGERSGGVVGGSSGGLGSTGADALTTALGVGGASLLLAGAGILLVRRRGATTA